MNKLLINLIVNAICLSLVILSPEYQVISHSASTFGYQYGNQTIIGLVNKSSPFDACTSLDSNMTNKIVLAIRSGSSECSFEKKVKNIENSGAKGAIIMNYMVSDILADELIHMGSENKYPESTIPSVFISYKSGLYLQSLISTSSNFSFPLVALNSTGEIIIKETTLWDMILSCFQLFIMIILFIGSMYLLSYIPKIWNSIKRYRLAHTLTSISYETPSIDKTKNKECPICLDEYSIHDNVVILPCTHVFHEKCLKEWIKSVKGICPLCRQPIFSDTMMEDEDGNAFLNNEAMRVHAKSLICLFFYCYILYFGVWLLMS